MTLRLESIREQLQNEAVPYNVRRHYDGQLQELFVATYNDQHQTL